ncbi:MAG: hypothetical protein HYT70_03920 [Candidatus Aenigmarchaeota archaeon]|nr:hypothetical protein [Candidatus Aenigmarchaeota archaeon]
MKKFLIGLLSFLLLVSPALALNISVSVDKNKVFMGDEITLTGKITFDNGTSSAFDYRAAVVAPKRIVVCDSNKTKTASDGTFSLKCKLPTAQEAASLGIPASDSRAVIPYVAGVAVKDPATNATVKKHARAILAVNQDKFSTELNGVSKSLDEFMTHAQNFVPECDQVAEKAARYNVTDVETQCLEIQQKVKDLITDAASLSEQAQQLESNISSSGIESFREALKTLRDDLKDLRNEIKDIKETIKSIKWEARKEVRKSQEELRNEIEEKRTEIKQQRMEIRDLRNRTRGVQSE